jgi:NADH:ubiquinone oxidoreductase subunit 4 (subunit M)
LVVGLLFFGLYPKPLIELIRPTVLTLLSSVK